jgi:ABC-type uncharacterized transport system involved in gliding motility auxiliary subunit
VIPFFQIDKEAVLEYDLAKLVHSLSTTKKPIVGLITGLSMGPGLDPATRQMREGWAWLNSLNEFFEVRQIDPANTKAIDKDVETLVVVHPKGWSEDLDYAIDQFVLRGGRLLLFLDPNAELDQAAQDPENPSAAMFASKASDLPRLLKSWGVEYDANQVVLDAAHALTVQTGAGPALAPPRDSWIQPGGPQQLRRDHREPRHHQPVERGPDQDGGEGAARAHGADPDRRPVHARGRAAHQVPAGPRPRC